MKLPFSFAFALPPVSFLFLDWCGLEVAPPLSALTALRVLFATSPASRTIPEGRIVSIGWLPNMVENEYVGFLEKEKGALGSSVIRFQSYS